MRTFDGEVMTQIGVYGGVPIYADTTLEPYSIIYVPIARNRMRTYERLRDRDLVGTTGSRTPTFPVAPTSALDADASRESIFGTPIDVGATTTRGATTPAPTAPAQVPAPVAGTTGVTTTRDIPRTRVESIPKPNTTDGIWLVFDAARWYSAGPAVVFDHARFTKIGEYRGFPVYRERHGASNRIWVAVVQDGPVAP